VLQIAAVEVPEEYMGSVVELLGKRRGQMVNMEASGFVPYFHYFIRSLVKCLVIICIIFGYRKQKAIRTVAIVVMIHQNSTGFLERPWSSVLHSHTFILE
jgi:predicted membrane GTPase involved in stress response